MQPPPLTAIAHGKLSSPVYFKFSRVAEQKIVQPLAASFNPSVLTRPLSASPSRSPDVCAYLSCSTRTRHEPRLRNFDTELPSSYCYEFRSDNRLESVANAHTAADLHVRPVSKTALVSRSWAPRTKLEITRCATSRNAFDLTASRLKATSVSRWRRRDCVT